MFKAFDAAPDLDQFQRGLFGAADQGGRRPGEPARDHLDRQAVRGAEVLLADQPHVGRLLVPGQPPRLGAAAGRTCAPSSRRTSTPPRVKERADIAKLNAGLQQELAGKGMAFNQPDAGAFRDKLQQGRLLRRVEGQVRRRGLGDPGEGRRQAGVTADGPCRRQRDEAAGDGCRPLAEPLWAASAGAVLGRAVEIRRDPGRGRDRDPVRRRGRALRASPAAHLVGRARLDPVPVAGDARRGGRLPPRRAHAHDGARRARRARAARASSTCFATCAALGVPAADLWPAFEYAYEESFITTPALEIPNMLARRGAAGRHLR